MPLIRRRGAGKNVAADNQNAPQASSEPPQAQIPVDPFDPWRLNSLGNKSPWESGFSWPAEPITTG